MNYLETIFNFLNTPLGLAISSFIFLFILNKIYLAKPSWAKYEGMMISAVKMTEKYIPNDTDNEVLSKADRALQYFINMYTKAKGKAPNKRLTAQVADGLSVVHEKLEQNGSL